TGAEKRRVGAFAADDRVVAGAAVERVVTAATVEGVVAVAAEELICARAPGQHVIAVAADQLSSGQQPVGFVERDRVVAVAAGGRDLGGVGGRRVAVDGYGAAVHKKVPCQVPAGRDGVALVVAGLGQHAGACGKARTNCHGCGPFKDLAAPHLEEAEPGADPCKMASTNCGTISARMNRIKFETVTISNPAGVLAGRAKPRPIAHPDASGPPTPPP